MVSLPSPTIQKVQLTILSILAGFDRVCFWLLALLRTLAILMFPCNIDVLDDLTDYDLHRRDKDVPLPHKLWPSY
jgi:hypothetical protein